MTDTLWSPTVAVESNVDVVKATLDGLKAMSNEEIAYLGELMRYDTKKFVLTCFPDIVCSNWTDEKKIKFLKGELKLSQIFPKHHLIMYDLYDRWIAGEINNLCFVLFRKAGKTAIKRMVATKIIAYHLAHVMMFVSETIGQAKEDVDSIKYYIEVNPIIKYLFANMKGGTWNKEEAEFQSQGSTTYIITKSVGSRMAGMLHRDFRVDFTFCDEFESLKNSNTETQRNIISGIIQKEIMHIGDGNFKHRLLIQNTIVHPESYAAKAKRDQRYNNEHGKYYECAISETPSVYYNHELKKYITDPPHLFQVGTPIWPDTLSMEYIKNQLEVFAFNNGGKDFWEILQEWWNIPRMDYKAIFFPERIEEVDVKFKISNGITYIEKMIDGEIHKLLVDVYDGIDPASGRNDQTDDTSKVTIARLPDNKWIILDVYVGIIEFEEQCNMIYDSIKKFRPKITLIESVNYQYSLYSVVRKEVVKQKYGTLIKDFNTQKSKNNKFKEGLTTLVNQGTISYITGCRNINVLKQELAHFNKEEDNDDTVDALYLSVIAAKDRIPKMADVNMLIRSKSQDTDIYSKAIAAIDARKPNNWLENYKESMRCR